MPERQVAKNLQLDEATERSSAHLELQEGGQVDSRWQLRSDPRASDWQPVEYRRPSQSEPSWILPALVGLVLIGVAGYMVYIGLNRLSSVDVASVQPEVPAIVEGGELTAAEQAAPVVAAVEQEATSTPLPTEEPTAEPTAVEEPTVEPTVALVEQEIATIANQFGVNARLEPSTTSEVLRILEEGETVVVLGEQESEEIEGNWLQVRTSEEAVVWISSQFVEIETQVVAGEAETTSAAVPEVDVRVTISSPAGLNARAEPDSASEIVALLPDDTSYRALSQSEDGQWIEVEVEEDSSAWIFLQLVIADNDLAGLPTPEERAAAEAEALAAAEEAAAEEAAAEEAAAEEAAAEEAAAEEAAAEEAAAEEAAAEEAAAAVEVAETGTVTETATITDTTTVTDTGAITDTAATTDTVAFDTEAIIAANGVVSITNQFGVNARSTTSTDGEILVVLEADTQFALAARNEDSSWVQIVLEDGTLAWVFAQAVEVPESLDDVPVSVPPDVGEPAEKAEDLVPPAADDSASVDEEAAEEAVAEEPAAEDAPADEAAADEPADEEAAAADDSATNADVEIVDTGITAKITSFLGAKARPAPTTEEAEIDTVPFNQELSVQSRSEDGEWIQIVLFEDQTAWVLATRVELSTPLEDVPVAP